MIYGRQKVLLPLFGFVMGLVLFSALSSFNLLFPYLSKELSVGSRELFYLGNLFYFSGMPLGKVMGRIFKFSKRSSLSSTLMISLIAMTLVLTPFVRSFPIFIGFRLLQGTSTFIMEIFSITFSTLFNDRVRPVANSIAISGVPGGVSFGTILPFIFSFNVLNTYAVMGFLSMVALIPFALLFASPPSARMPIFRGGTYRMSVTWLLGGLWMTIAGFNLIFASLLPIFVSVYSPGNVVSIMNIFGYGGVLGTVAGGIISYILYPLLNSYRKITIVSVIGYVISIPGFIILAFVHGAIPTEAGVSLVMFETLSIASIYSLPINIYGNEKVANGTWDFSLVGSSGHIIAPLTIIPLAMSFGFTPTFLIIMLSPIYGAIASFILPKHFIGVEPVGDIGTEVP